MEIDRPPPGEELNTGEVTEARPASSVIVVRDAEARGANQGGGASEGGRANQDGGASQDGGLELLLVQRNPQARFMGGAWVFPGGGVHAGETEAETAVREAEEEAGLSLDPATLVPFSRWITPRQVKVRFDTHFFVAPTPPGAEPCCDGEECVDLCWIAPAAALEAGRRDELFLVFPTIKHLEQLAEFDSVDALLEHARSRRVQPVEPRVLVDGGIAQVLLPGEPGYEDA